MPMLHLHDVQLEDQRIIEKHLVALQIEGKSERTIDARRGLLVRLSYWLETNRRQQLGTARTDDLLAWAGAIMYLASGAAASRETRRAYMVHCRAFYRWRGEFVGVDPAAAIKPTKVHAKRVAKQMSEDDLRLALRILPEPTRTWVALAAFAALRASEIASIQGVDIDKSESPTILTVHGKGGKQRRVPLIPPLEALLMRHVVGDQAAWRRPAGGRVNGHWVSGTAAEALHAIGIEKTLHSCRHRAGRKLYLATKDIRLVQDLLGHESLNTTALYTEAAQELIATGLTAIAEPMIDLL